jgi:hypothetical protein
MDGFPIMDAAKAAVRTGHPGTPVKEPPPPMKVINPCILQGLLVPERQSWGGLWRIKAVRSLSSRQSAAIHMSRRWQLP